MPGRIGLLVPVQEIVVPFHSLSVVGGIESVLFGAALPPQPIDFVLDLEGFFDINVVLVAIPLTG